VLDQAVEAPHMVRQAISNPLGVHALVWAGDTSPRSVDYAVAKTKETGYDLLELSLHDTANLDVAAARRRLIDADLRVVCSRGLTFDADISSEDPRVVERGEQLLHESLRTTAELGGTHFTGVLYSALGKYDRPLTDAGRRNVVAVLGA
jgi:D-psicose/D-tagatose/L-ribulose 3-epimerase